MEYEKKIHYLKLSILAVIPLIFIFSALLFKISSGRERKIFIFPSVESGRQVVEYRYLEKGPAQENIRLFVEELLLGSSVERTKLLFARETRVNSCFLRKGVLYLDFSAELLGMGDGVLDIKDGVNLLKKNIKKNFKGVSKVEVFVGGKYAYE